MSIETLTGDEFLNLDAETHRDALEQYAGVIHTLTQNLGSGVYDEAQKERALDKLTSHLTMRKVHKTRLAELEGEELAERSAMTQYHLNELTPVS